MRDNELDRLLRDSAPDARPSDEHRRMLRMQLVHNSRHHGRPWRLRMPSAAAAAALVGIALLAGWSIPIGSDVRDLVDGGDLGIGGTRILRPAFRDGGISAADTTAQAHRRAEDLSDDLLAGAFVVVGVTGKTVGAETYFDFLVESTGLDAGAQINVEIPAYAAEKAWVNGSLKSVRTEMVPRILAEDWEGVTTATMTIEGRRFQVVTRTMTLSGLGVVQLHDGVLLD